MVYKHPEYISSKICLIQNRTSLGCVDYFLLIALITKLEQLYFYTFFFVKIHFWNVRKKCKLQENFKKQTQINFQDETISV